MDSWIDDFRQMMTTQTIDISQIQAAMRLKGDNLPRFIYKYRSFNNRSVRNLKNGVIWISRASKFNDPYECAMFIDFEKILKGQSFSEFFQTIPKEAKDFLLAEEIARISDSDNIIDTFTDILLERDASLSVEQQSEIRSGMKTYRDEKNLERVRAFSLFVQDSVQMCSFSLRNDSLVMWSHYAKEHTGFCLEYDVSRLSDFGPGKANLFPVKHSKEMFNATQFFVNIDDKGHLNNVYAQIAATTKSPDWEYESEWRMLFIMGQQNPDWAFNIGFPSRIFVGPRMLDRNEKVIRNIAKKMGIPVAKMELAESEFRMKEKTKI